MSELLKRIGIERDLTFGDIDNISLMFLEQQCAMFEFTRKRHIILSNNPDAMTVEIDEEEAPHRQRLHDLYNVFMFLRSSYRAYICDNDQRKGEELERCKNSMMHWVRWWAWTQDPRLLQYSLPAQLPFVPFPKQAEMLMTFDRLLRSGLSGIVDKSRDEGATVSATVWILYHFLFSNGFRASVGSQKEEKVDFKKSVNTLFGKIRYTLYNLPNWMRPPVMLHEDNTFDTERSLIYKARENEIVGEIGDNIGRSGRATVVVIDEWQDIEKPELVQQSISATSNCKIFIGTMRGMNHFYQMIQAGREVYMSVRWFHDPRKTKNWRDGKPDIDSPWRKHLEATEDPVTIAQEYDGDPNASVEGSMIPAQWVASAIDWMPIPENGDKAAGFDVATGRGKNEAVYVSRNGPVVMQPYAAPYKTVAECAAAVVAKGTEDGIQLLNYDEDGLGESMIGLFDFANERVPFRMVGLHGNHGAGDYMIPEEGRKASDKFLNKRAERWWSIRKRFERTYEHRKGIREWPMSAMISIPNDMLLISQLSQPRIVMRVRMGVESKESMRTRGVSSPDRADALVYSFDCAEEGQSTAATQFNYIENSKNIEMPDRGIYDKYGSIYCSRDNQLSAISAIWWRNREGNPLLQVIDENKTNMPDDMAEWIKNTMRFVFEPPREIIGNSRMFGDGWQKTPDKILVKSGVRVKKSPDYDPHGSLMILNTLISNKQVEINSANCRELTMQMSHWSKESGTEPDNFGYACALLMLVARLKSQGVMDKPQPVKPYSHDKDKKMSIKDLFKMF